MHPVMQGVTEFSTFDQAYVHSNLNPDITVLQERVEGTAKEPVSWVRDQGKGRVFYTAYGYNDSTWIKPDFFKLVKNGVLWCMGDQVKDQIAKLNIPDLSIYNEDFSDFAGRHVVAKAQEALSPEQSQKLMQVPADFEVKLFAAEPDITNPIAMSWDEKGRLWIVESVDYPNTFLETDGAANDRIKICEDTNGDGKADKFTVFADKLNIPTSITFANGGVIVAMAPDFVFLKDTNGDDKADVREKLISGWGKADTHAGPSSLQYGFNNKIWGVVGYSGFTGPLEGKNLKFIQGVYTFNPDGKQFEFLAGTSNNTWGLGISEDNNVFISTANGVHSTYYSMPGKLTQRTLPSKFAPTAQAGNRQPSGSAFQSVQSIQGHTDSHTMTPSIRQIDYIGGFTSAAGHQLYTARNFPKEYWNRIAFVNEPSVRLVHQAVLEADGAGFAEKDGWNLFASSDEWVGPVQASVGPDGAVWIADWYSFLIQHNVSSAGRPEVNFVIPSMYTQQPKWGQGNAFISPLRDLERGRIYRIAKPYMPVQLSRTNTASLLAGLENDNMFWRMNAQRLLVETKNLKAIPGLYSIINNQKVDEIGLNSSAVHALWTLKGLEALDGTNAEALQVLAKALSHTAAGVRKAAVQVLPKDAKALEIIQKSGLINDPKLNVRLSAFLAIAEIPESEEAGKAIYIASLAPENGKDEWISRALLAAALRHETGFLAAAPKTQPQILPGAELSLSQRIFQAINKEVYTLSVSRRGTTMTFSPDVTGKEIIITGTLTKGGGQTAGAGGRAAIESATTGAPAASTGLVGIIVAQGGKTNGYVLYIQDGKVNMLVKQNGNSYKATSTVPLPESFNLLSRMTANGDISIEIDGKVVATAKAPSGFTKSLDEALRTGVDAIESEKVGDYPTTLAFGGGAIQSPTLELIKSRK
jgi:uncharacterized protein